MIKKIIKSTFWFVAIVPLILTICSCVLFSDWHHMPHYLNQADVFFEGNDGSKLFEARASHFLRMYSSTRSDYQTGMYFEGMSGTNYCKGVTNSKYLTTFLYYPEGSSYHCFIRIFDKSYNVVRTIKFNDNETTHDLACTEDYLYIVLGNQDSEKCPLIRYDYSLDSVSVLVEDISGIKSYQDDDVHLFFIKKSTLFRLFKYEESRTPLYHFDGKLFRTDKIDLFLSNNNENIIVNSEEKEHVLKTNLPLNRGSYWFYEKAFLVDGQLIFAIYKQSNKRQCAASTGRICVCSLEESYLFKYDLGLNELSLIKQFDSGTYLIDYDLDGYKYYKDGGLYINDVLFRECENIYPEYVEHLTNEKEMDYYFSYYNGEFYGI